MAIKTKFRSLSGAQTKRLFGTYSPLSTFAAKIDMTFALGITSEETHVQLGHFRKLRNHFAHSLTVTSLEDPSTAPLLDPMRDPESANVGGIDVFSKCVIKIRDALTAYMSRTDEHYRSTI
jgi:hypothetical protein